MGIVILQRKWKDKPPLGVRLLSGHPLAAGLVGFWLMNEGGGLTISSLVGAGLAGTMTSTVSWKDDTGGRGLSFTGSSSDVSLGTNVPTFGSGNFSFLCRANAAGSQNHSMFAARGNNPVTRLWAFYLDNVNSHRLQFEVFDGTNDSNVNTGTTGYTGLHTLACTKQPSGSGGLTIYADGIQVGNSPTYTATGTFDNAADTAYLGFRPDATTEWYAGTMYWAMLWNRALSAAEVQLATFDPFSLLVSPRRIVVPSGFVPITSRHGLSSQVIVG